MTRIGEFRQCAAPRHPPSMVMPDAVNATAADALDKYLMTGQIPWRTGAYAVTFAQIKNDNENSELAAACECPGAVRAQDEDGFGKLVLFLDCGTADSSEHSERTNQ